MDNNQQTASQPAGKPDLSAATSPDAGATASVTNLGVNDPGKMSGVQSPLTGANESMTTGAKAGGPIVSTEQGSVKNATRPSSN